jgi:hypothetical protein
MRPLQTIVVLALVPSLIARTESVSELLHNPQNGQASLRFADGTRSEGMVIRVTDQFVTFQPAPFMPGACENIELSRIAGIDWPSGSGGFRNAVFSLLWLLAPLAPILGGASEGTATPSNPMLGNWESVRTQTPGRIDIDGLEFRPVMPGAGFRYSGFVTRMSVVIQRGTYRVDGGTLHLNQLGGGLDDIVPVGFECDALIAVTSTRAYKLKSTGDQPRRASPPIVGRWVESSEGSQTDWDYKPDGTYEQKSVDSSKTGIFAKTKKGVKVTFGSGATEDWEVHVNRGHLFISIGGNVTEYKKRSAHP